MNTYRTHLQLAIVRVLHTATLPGYVKKSIWHLKFGPKIPHFIPENFLTNIFHLNSEYLNFKVKACGCDDASYFSRCWWIQKSKRCLLQLQYLCCSIAAIVFLWYPRPMDTGGGRSQKGLAWVVCQSSSHMFCVHQYMYIIFSQCLSKPHV